MPENKDQSTLVTYAVLCALTPLIPIPLVDDLAKSYFRRQMVRQLATYNGQTLTPQDVNTLADEKGGSCLLGCLGTALLYPLKAIFRKIFFFLEWKRAIDTASQTYYHGYMVSYALQNKWCAPVGPHSPSAVRAALDGVLAQTDTGVVNRAVRGVFAQSKAALIAAAKSLADSLRRLTDKSARQNAEQTLSGAEQQEKTQIADISNRLQQALNAIPAQHFEQLCAQMGAALGVTKS